MWSKVRAWFRLTPNYDAFAAGVLRHLARNESAGWTYDPAGRRLANLDGGTIKLVDLFEEYARSPRSDRAEILKRHTNASGSDRS